MSAIQDYWKSSDTFFTNQIIYSLWMYYSYVKWLDPRIVVASSGLQNTVIVAYEELNCGLRSYGITN